MIFLEGLTLTDNFKILDDLTKEINEGAGYHNLPIELLMTPDFIKTHSCFTDFECLLLSSRLKDKYTTNSDLYSSAEWDLFISKNTNVNSWRELRIKAAIIYVKSRLPHQL